MQNIINKELLHTFDCQSLVLILMSSDVKVEKEITLFEALLKQRKSELQKLIPCLQLHLIPPLLLVKVRQSMLEMNMDTLMVDALQQQLVFFRAKDCNSYYSTEISIPEKRAMNNYVLGEYFCILDLTDPITEIKYKSSKFQIGPTITGFLSIQISQEKALSVLLVGKFSAIYTIFIYNHKDTKQIIAHKLYCESLRDCSSGSGWTNLFTLAQLNSTQDGWIFNNQLYIQVVVHDIK